MVNLLVWVVTGMLVGYALSHLTRSSRQRLLLVQMVAGCLGAVLGGTVFLIFDTAPLGWFRGGGLAAALVGALIVLSAIHLTIARISAYLEGSYRLGEGRDSMTDRQTDQLRGFDLLSQAAQQRLHARIFAAGGTIAAVADEIRAQLNDLDQTVADHPELASIRQADRAFAVAQLTYLELLAAQEQPADTRPQRGWLTRLRDRIGRLQSAK